MLARVSQVAALVLVMLSVSSCASTRVTRDDPAWARHPEMGRCFDDATSFVESAIGPRGHDDENIRVRLANPLSDGSVWIVDQTSQTNYQWYLLQPGERTKLCLTLFVPAAAQVVLSVTDEQQTADAKTQASPDFPVKELRFARTRRERVFHPIECMALGFSGTKARRESVSCAGVFDWNP